MYRRQTGAMRTRPALLILLLPLTGCIEPTGALLGANIGSVAVAGRGVGDIVISAATGQDCSIVHWEKHKAYCTAIQPPPEPPPFCTRSLGRVECWLNPEAFPNLPTAIADGPRVLTPEQDARRLRPWP